MSEWNKTEALSDDALAEVASGVYEGLKYVDSSGTVVTDHYYCPNCGRELYTHNVLEKGSYVSYWRCMACSDEWPAEYLQNCSNTHMRVSN